MRSTFLVSGSLSVALFNLSVIILAFSTAAAVFFFIRSACTWVSFNFRFAFSNATFFLSTSSFAFSNVAILSSTSFAALSSSTFKSLSSGSGSEGNPSAFMSPRTSSASSSFCFCFSSSSSSFSLPFFGFFGSLSSPSSFDNDKNDKGCTVLFPEFFLPCSSIFKFLIFCLCCSSACFFLHSSSQRFGIGFVLFSASLSPSITSSFTARNPAFASCSCFLSFS